MRIKIRIMFAFLLCAMLSLCLGPAAVAENGVFAIPAGVSVIESEAFSGDRKSTRLNSSHTDSSRMPSSA